MAAPVAMEARPVTPAMQTEHRRLAERVRSIRVERRRHIEMSGVVAAVTAQGKEWSR